MKIRQWLLGITLVILLVGCATPRMMGWQYQDLPMAECAWCHQTTHLNRHHIHPQGMYPAEKNVQTNLIVFCERCHFVIGHRCDYHHFNPDVKEIVEKYQESILIQSPGTNGP